MPRRLNRPLLALLFLPLCSAQPQTFTLLKSFGSLPNKAGTVTRSTLVLGDDGTLYGTTSAGGGLVRGAVFKMGTNGSNFVLLKQFTNVLEGAFPKSSLLLAGTTLYGTTSAGGSEDGGTLFRMNIDGSGFTVLKNLPAGSYNRNLPPLPGGGGSWHEPNPPMGGLALGGTTLYGTTRSGGALARGNVFKLETNGSGYTVIKEFNGADGGAPTGELVVSGSTLYGTTSLGGSANTGTVFRVNVDGTGFATLKHFAGPDGAGPYAGLVLSGGTLFGVTVRGGTSTSQAGTVFKINTNGSGFAVLKSFNASAFPPQGVGPMARLLLSGNILYGTAATVLNYTPGVGTIFRLNTDGTGFATVMAPTGGPSGPAFYSQAGVVLSGSTLYGTMNSISLTPIAGSVRDEVFCVHTNGTGRTTLKRFDNISGDASQPGPLLLTNGMLYGMTALGGISNAGTIFALSTNGTGYTRLRSFNGTIEGRATGGRLLCSGNQLFGGTDYGGGFSRAAIFRMNINGTGFTLLRDVGDTGPPSALAGNVMYGAGSDTNDGAGIIWKMNLDGGGFTVVKDLNNAENLEGSGPNAVTLVGNTLYGGNNYGGAFGSGNLFKVNTDGSGFSVLQSFQFGDNIEAGYRLVHAGNALYGITPSHTNAYMGAVYKVDLEGNGFGVVNRLSDARLASWFPYPHGLLASGPMLYGATYGSATSGGALFQINTNGSNFAVLHTFGPAPEGARPNGDLILAGTTLYGTTAEGGEVGEGTIFRLDLRPRLNIARSAMNVAVSWPSYATTYTLEENTDLRTTNWGPVGSTLSDDGTNITITLSPTNPVAGYRLR
jgi:uncharacterized repeat protein (TIGR03803 family)